MEAQSEKIPTVFAHLTDEELEMILKNRVLLKYRKGENICKQGSFASQIFIITEGNAKIYIEHHDKNLILKIAGVGELIGLQSIFVENTFLYSASCIDDMMVYSINIQIVMDMIKTNPVFAAEIIKILNTGISQYFERFISLTQKQLHGRLADAILHLSKHVYNSQEFKLTLTRKDIAEFTGMSTESAIRILKEFHNDKIINMDGKVLKITSMKLLEKLSEIG